ncbi:galactolipase DONGLE, chloroplastic-like [Malania oleifera]|uniref:galactolipase DONGLE, chloroplastic-like n=1 Tax=Malania oleifera TaxID=397392 RepID=UPI0025ADDA2B|nr:galactolipase DONGLE, chloroplastic-like [Malania oleifera]
MAFPTPNTNHIMASCAISEPSISGYSPPSFRPLTLPVPDWSSDSLSQRPSIASVIAPATTAPRFKQSKTLASVWREIHGSKNWDNLLEPLNPLLRDEIIRYGELITACYKAFNLNPGSKRYLHCKYGRKNMLGEVGMVDSGYEVTRYIYATPGISIPIDNGNCCSRWLGYVAVSSSEEVKKLGRRDIAIVFRGTVTNPEWMANFMSSLTPARLDPINDRPEVKVESGFLNLYTSDDSDGKFGIRSCREQLLSEVSRIINKYKGEELSITIAGHSMGSSIALLLAYDIAELGLNQCSSEQKIPITVYSFGGPRVGNSGFKERCEELGIKVLRIANVNDPITNLPGIIFNENFKFFWGKYELPWRSSCYTHVGVELTLDFFNMQNPWSVHDLGTYIKLLKSPGRVQRRKSRIDMVEKARNYLLGMNSMETWQWINLIF